MNNIKYCIFCFKNNKEVEFNKEHIIPQNVGGKLFIDIVCKSCNGELGNLIDNEILKVPEIIEAFEELKIPFDKEGIYRYYYNITGESDDLKVPFHFRNDALELIPKKIPDKGFIFPETDLKNNLKKSVLRDNHIKKQNVPKDEIDKEINIITEKFKHIKPGQSVTSSLLKRNVSKNYRNFKIRITSKNVPQLERLISKIFIEFSFLINPKLTFERLELILPFYKLVIDGVKNNDIFSINRMKSEFNNYLPIHYITFYNFTSRIRMKVGFFSKILYSLESTIYFENYWNQIEEYLKLKDIIGLHYEQNLREHTKHFWLILADESTIFLF